MYTSPQIMEQPNDKLRIFEGILDQVIEQLRISESVSHKMSPEALEQLVHETLCNCSQGTIFDGAIQLISGKRFPDIVIKEHRIGLEVKKVTSNTWKTIGNSVEEGTRVSDLEQVYLLFAKLGGKIAFKWRRYEECLSRAVVTHSPRYEIDMELPEGGTLFAEMGTTYEELCQAEHPAEEIMKHYRSKLKPGETTWWLGHNDVRIHLWKSLNKEEKHELTVKGFCLFPEIVGNDQEKYSRIALWLLKNGVASHNLRDIYTSRGKENNPFYSDPEKVPRIIFQLHIMLPDIAEALGGIDASELCEAWDITTAPDAEARKREWIDRIVEASKLPWLTEYLEVDLGLRPSLT